MEMEFFMWVGHDGAVHPLPMFLLLEPIFFVSASGTDGIKMGYYN